MVTKTKESVSLEAFNYTQGTIRGPSERLSVGNTLSASEDMLEFISAEIPFESRLSLHIS